MKIRKLTLFTLLFVFILTCSTAYAQNTPIISWQVNNEGDLHIGEIMDTDIVIVNTLTQKVNVTTVLFHHAWMEPNSFIIEEYNQELISGENKLNYKIEIPIKAELDTSQDYACIIKFKLENGTIFDSAIIRPAPITITQGMSIYEKQTINTSTLGLVIFFFFVGIFTLFLFKEQLISIGKKNRMVIPVAIFTVAFIIYGISAFENFNNYGLSQPLLQGFSLTGDEPHYIVATQTLLKGTLDVSQTYLPSYVQHSRVSSGFLLNGTTITTHSLGIPILGAIPYALVEAYCGSGVWGMIIMSCFFSALTSIIIYKLGLYYIKDTKIAILTALTFAFSTLLYTWSGQVFGAPILAFFLTFAVYKTVTAQTNRDWIISAISITLLTFIKRNVIFLSVILILMITGYLYRNKKIPQLKYFLITVAICLIPIFIYEFGIVGWGQIPFVGNTDVMSIPDTYNILGVHISQVFWLGLIGHWIDANSGILWYSPILIFSFLGMYKTIKSNRKFNWILPMTVFMFWYLSTGVVPYWHGWLSPPGRYIIPILPLLAIPMFYTLKEFIKNKIFLLSYFTLFLAGFVSNFLIATNRVLGYVVLWINGIPRNWYWSAVGEAFNINPNVLPDYAYAWLNGGGIGNVPQSATTLAFWAIILIITMISFLTFKFSKNIILNRYNKEETENANETGTVDT